MSIKMPILARSVAGDKVALDAVMYAARQYYAHHMLDRGGEDEVGLFLAIQYIEQGEGNV